MTTVLHVPATSLLNKLDEPLREKFVQAQTNLLEMHFPTAGDLYARACDDLRVSVPTPDVLGDQSAKNFADRPLSNLHSFFSTVLSTHGVPEQAIVRHASNLAHRVQLLRAFSEPDMVITQTCNKVADIVERFPKQASDIQCGRNPGDVLDPYIMAAAQQLMFAGDFESTVSATVAHKVLMMIEGLLGHLHEDVLGAMRGNVRAPEPRGVDQENLDPACNPFPGADIVQPPRANKPIRFHQIKSKTGSAKGGDARRLGLQLQLLKKTYGGDLYYDALIGNTLRGHRSMTGVLRAEPTVVVLVGEAAFRVLTDSSIGPELLLRLYQATFEVAAKRTGYNVPQVVAAIFGEFRQRAEAAGEGFLETLLHQAISGPSTQQDSRLFRSSGRRRAR